MSKIEELLKNEKVEWKKLGDVCEDKFWIMPSTPKFSNDFKIPYITGKNIKNGEIDFDNVKYISEEDYVSFNKNRSIIKDDILISMIGTIGEIGVVKENNKFYGQNLYLLRLNPNIILTRYFYHFFSQNRIKDGLVSKKNNSSQGYIRAGNIENLEIPIPSIETQERIVKTLDKFTNYVTELQAELQARTKQYEYYRDMLLSEEYLNKLSYYLEENRLLKLEWKTLDEISVGSLSYGSGASAIDYDGETRYIRITDINDSGGLNKEKASPNVVEEKYILNNEDILFARSGATVGKNYIHLINDKCVYAGYLIRLIVNKEIALPKFVFYCLNTNRYKIFVDNTKSRGSQPNINAKQYGSFKIPIIPIEIQNIVVEILDKFQSLLADTKGLLPQEIEQRQKQYEYYREKLLTFDENSAKREREREHISLIRI